jgi:outer membrane protein
MKIFFLILLIFIKSNTVFSEENIIFFIESAFKNNPKLNAERQNFKSIKENINISRSEFLPSLTISGSQEASTSTNRTNKSGLNMADSNSDTETKSISIDQKVFQGFQGYNSLKKSKLEVEKASFQLKNIEQEIILKSISAYYDLVFKNQNKKFNLANVDLLERQVESDKARLQKGEITLTDLAQSESSLAGANADLISAKTELLTSKTDFERIIRIRAPEAIIDYISLETDLPSSLKSALEISTLNNPKLMMAKLDSLIAAKNLDIEKAKLSPSASLNYSKSEKDDFSSIVDSVDQETVKATISWPLIKGGKNFSSIKKSKYKNQKMKLLLEDTQNEVKTSITNAWSVYQSSESVLLATRSQLKAAEIANEGITLEYNSGNTRTTLELIQSRTLLLNSRISHAKATRDLITSKFRLLSEMGNLSMSSIKG